MASLMTGGVKLAVCVAVATAAAVALTAQSPPPSSKPNILIVQADDLGYGDVGAYGQTRFATPNLDRLAAEGIRFTHYYAGSPVCAPSRTSLMTGLHTGHASIRGNGEFPLGADEPTMAMSLREAGYRTAVVGKWGLGLEATTGRPDRKGFETSFGFLDHRAAHRQFTDHLYRNASRVPVEPTAYVNDLFTAEAQTFIESQDPRPFFLYLNYTVPHAELRVPEDELRLWRGKFPEERPFANAGADGRPSGPDGPSLGYRTQPTPRAAFAAMVTRMDRDIGRLVETLGRLGLDRQTLVLFTSDNGPHQEGGADPAFFRSSGPYRGIKRDLYEGGIRVPMIARWVGTVPRGRVSAHPWAHWDVWPTVAQLAGAAVPTKLDGLSMVSALKGQRQATHEFFYWEFHERGFQQAVRMGEWKALRLKAGTPLELYHLGRDPGETKNVAADYPAVVARIETYLRTARTPSDRFPVP